MAQIQIVVIDVAAPQFVKTARGGYNTIEIAYKKDGKVEGRKLVDFANKEVFAMAKAMKPGEVYDVNLEKDAKDYWQWAGVVPAGQAANVGEATTGTVASSPAPSGSIPSSRPASGRVTGSNYETPEERARRQVLIVRQSSLTASLGLLTHNSPKGQIDVVDVLGLAQRLTDWVFEKPAEVVIAMKAVQDMSDDVPL